MFNKFYSLKFRKLRKNKMVAEKALGTFGQFFYDI